MTLLLRQKWEWKEYPHNPKNDAGLSRKNILRQLENSLKRLQTTYVDLYYVHCIDPTTPLKETLRTLDNLVKEGKIRYFACSNFSGNQPSAISGDF